MYNAHRTTTKVPHFPRSTAIHLALTPGELTTLNQYVQVESTLPERCLKSFLPEVLRPQQQHVHTPTHAQELRFIFPALPLFNLAIGVGMSKAVRAVSSEGKQKDDSSNDSGDGAGVGGGTQSKAG